MAIFDVHWNLGGGIVPAVSHNAASIGAAMTARGIDGAVLFSAHARDVDTLAGNRILKAMVGQDERLYGCLTTHTNRSDKSIAAMRELMPLRRFVGMCIVGSKPDQPIDQLVADDILNAYRRYGKPLFIHTHNAECVRAALAIAKNFTMLKVVLLGMGGVDWRAAIAAAHASTNIVLETSGHLDRAKLPAAVEVLGAHRVVFGSDAPHMDAAAAAGLIEDSDLSDDTRARILGDNARRLFELQA